MSKDVHLTDAPYNSSFADTKRHYAILDGLRGVAAMMVVTFHIFEGHATSRFDQMLNHGYLAVDFFFVLSGFVIGYAYDDRWHRMSLGKFFKRRLIRLHPMIIIGATFGALMFYFQGGDKFPLINETPVWQLLLIMLVGMALLPVPPALDIRGWAEMHPLNGPAWSLSFEYLACILYALFIRRFSVTVLAISTVVAGGALINIAVFGPQGDVNAGWSFVPNQMYMGFVRLMFPFMAGLLLSRIIKPASIKHAFLWCSAVLVVILAMPRIGTESTTWMNGVYDVVCIIIVFPLIVFIGASGEANTGIFKKICNFLGELSYPLYIIHYPFVYTYMAWVSRNDPSFSEALPVAVLTVCFCVVLAYFCARFYDVPVRRWLSQRFMQHQNKGRSSDPAGVAMQARRSE